MFDKQENSYIGEVNKAFHEFLKRHLPKEEYSSWFRDVKVISVSDGCVQVTVANKYVREKITPELERGILEFLRNWVPAADEITDIVISIPGGLQKQESDEPEMVFHLTNESVTEALIQPQRHVPIPKYFFRWAAYIKATLWFMVVAFWQTAFLKHAESGKFCCRSDEIIRWCALSPASFWRFLDDDVTRHFVKKMPDSDGSSPNHYMISTSIPLTPMDQDYLRSRLIEEGIQTDPMNALFSITSQKIKLQEMMESCSGIQKMQTVSEIVWELIGENELTAADKKVVDAYCEKLNELLVFPTQSLHVPWYFFLQWLPIIGHGPALMILLLQSQGFYNPLTGEIRDLIKISEGYSQLAAQLGVKSKTTMYTWLSRKSSFQFLSDTPAEKTRFERERKELLQDLTGRFLKVLPNESDVLEIKLRLDSVPLTPADEILRGEIAQIIEKAFELQIIDLVRPSAEFILKALSSSGEYSFESLIKHLSTDLRVHSGPEFNFESLGTWLQYSFESRDWKSCTDLRVLKALINLTTQKEKILYQPTTSVEPDGWSLDDLLRITHVSNSSRDEIKNRKITMEDYLAWILFGFADLKNSIQSPVNFAISRIVREKDSNPGGIYFKLANLKKQDLIRLIQSGVSGFTENEAWSRYSQEISPNNLLELKELLCIEA